MYILDLKSGLVLSFFQLKENPNLYLTPAFKHKSILACTTIRELKYQVTKSCPSSTFPFLKSQGSKKVCKQCKENFFF